ncbi:MafI family immunity protein [Streptomyces sp. NPDC086549]|uniref:MafI family immunity protein n=1 Tax=Streptomyces sp. NPDC086549 TaxID=3365752 RepID=UPI00381EE1E7
MNNTVNRGLRAEGLSRKSDESTVDRQAAKIWASSIRSALAWGRLVSLSYRAEVEALLVDSPLTSEAVITDVRHLLAHGEWGLAFDTMCSWIYEDALLITPQYHARLVAMAVEMGTPKSVERMDELLIG